MIIFKHTYIMLYICDKIILKSYIRVILEIQSLDNYIIGRFYQIYYVVCM